jgi:hypothetical protein
MKNRLVLLAIVLALVACGHTNPPATVSPTATKSIVEQAQPTATEASTPLPAPATVVVPATSTAPIATTPIAMSTAVSNTDWVNTASVDGDFYVRGNPNASIRLIDYSDFL